MDPTGHHDMAVDALRAGASARRRVNSANLRPYGRSMVVAALAQILLFGAIGVAQAAWWNWLSVGAILSVGLLLGLGYVRYLSGQRTAVPAGLGRWDRATQVVAIAGGISLVALMAVVAPPLGMTPTGNGAWGLVAGGIGAAAAIPRLILGAGLLRRAK